MRWGWQLCKGALAAPTQSRERQQTESRCWIKSLVRDSLLVHSVLICWWLWQDMLCCLWLFNCCGVGMQGKKPAEDRAWLRQAGLGLLCAAALAERL